MMSPLPVVAIPIAALVLVHANVAPGTLLVNGILIDVPGQNVWLATAVITGFGLMVMLNTIGEPPQVPFSDTVIVPVRATPVVFAGAVKSAMFPEPEAAKPISVLLFVHVTAAPVFTEKLPTLTRSPGHKLRSDFWVITLSGLIVMLNEIDELIQPSFVAVTLMVPVIGEPVLLFGAV
jgi:hypothetical protein